MRTSEPIVPEPAVPTRLAPSPAHADGTASDQTIERQALALLTGGLPLIGGDRPWRDGVPGAGAGAAAWIESLDLRLAISIAETLLDARVAPAHPVIARTIDRIARRFPAEDGAPRRIAVRFCDLEGDERALADALRLFARLSRRDWISAHIAPPLAVLLTYAEADGTIPSWALPDDATPETLETIACLAHALACWDARRFLGMIVAAARWVADRQRPDGSWPSARADDGDHASWKALRLLGAAMPNHPVVAGAARQLRARQHPGAGWGANGSEPHATALAILALRAARTDMPEPLCASARAILAGAARGWSDPSGAQAAMPIDTFRTAMFVLKAWQALQPPASPR